ncbi:hypothetical protein QUF76_16685 [Desulfobacterales bacterium HSG16]|nr:hypothetical protein [Desulfobacterales bacterium HSG16]
MPVKLNHYYTIIPDKITDYEKFMIKEFIPGINKLGIHAVAGWTILIGAYSEIILETVGNDLELIEKSLQNPKYKDLSIKLFNFIKDYKTKVLVKTGKIDSYSTDIKKDTIKFNQTWNIKNDKKAEYDKFTSEEFYPCLEEMGVHIASEWEVLIGGGPHIICEGRVQNVEDLIDNLQCTVFQAASKTLKQYVTNYESRILSFHIQKVKGYKSASYNLIHV